MTFEEFFIKKKIDLAQLKAAEPGLYSEFESHYRQMGEKSFDHSKKFLFNKLRRVYHTKEEPKPVPPAEVTKVNELASQAEPLLSPSVEATVYTPRFKPAAIKPPPTTQQENPESIQSEETKPAFKPRFKPRLTSSAPSEVTEDKYVKEEKTETKTNKPAYKPRFKAAVAAPRENDPEIKEAAPAEQAKPAFKPRFKPGITNAPPVPPASAPKELNPEDQQKQEEENSDANSRASDSGDPVSETAAQAVIETKPAYKPRFKPSITKPKNED
ncbi:MAG: hypothetical protein ACO1NS_09715 [Daejeonella sp.]|uniref:hypothetical protein n=1 Tax=Daejeonella sp. JGW-45 TaxID=3034148 RepID=UPI0023ED9F21|nr:hypothetical protein [Daejeonella sp. JGW-45]